ncbi:MAG TPA: bifunctional 5,10-methylenetetrahydrofolate dehydrogenase/5,10-methenyltetrahydrofolate cyclohydrolase [Phycisphaerae bacterium]|nr:bifunctional 5,10-methylenetetrahydrofolate dehydrogenase/5,10-methenyltetrahydrofolate cyclohydrolase [Phycisphaerae bacterium]HNU43834.1 bifunctional 5,10-methylenetetrahydrofolate dehydrogenase/5,10-methenyltetrahydrofolate cyclohydrolase [Phycisphaerae bacterium]
MSRAASSTGARVIDGQAVARRIKAEAAQQVAALARDGVRVNLHAVMVGDPVAGEIYARSQERHCQEVGIEYHLHVLDPAAREPQISARIRQLNADESVTGILLLLPLPAGIDTPALQYCIDPYKDVEGVNPANIGLLFYDSPIIAPCTARAVMELVKEAGCTVPGLEAVIVGQGEVAGRPTSLFLVHAGATVTSCHIATRDLGLHTRQAELLVVAVGKPNLIHADHVRAGAVVIDVGINRIVNDRGERQVVGDVAFDEVCRVAEAITPVPGGVGPVTVAILLRATAEAARQQLTARRRVGL